MKLNNMNGENLLINSYEFTSSIVNWKKYTQSNIYIIIINEKLSKIVLVSDN